MATTTKPHTENSAGYPIGVVARLTGIHPETLRIWERRYGVVKPDRSGRGSRLYAQEDIHRLTLIKTLVDAGHAVSIVAPLSTAALQERIATMTAHGRATPSRAGVPCRVVALGDALPALLAQRTAELRDIELVGVYRDAGELESSARTLAPDVLLLEYPSLQLEAVAEVRKRLADSGAKAAVLVYGFAPRQAVQELERGGVVCLRAPVGLPELQRAITAVVGAPLTPPPLAVPAPESIPARRFTPDQLGRIAATTPKVRCECPHHLADLINSLAAFERYSKECENRNAEDAQVHALLFAAAGAARALMETALDRVVEFEGIALS